MGTTEPVSPKPVSPVVGESPIGTTPAASSPDISRVENLVAAAQQEAAAASPLAQSQEQFQNQFGPQTPAPVEQPVADPMAAALESLGTQTAPAQTPSSNESSTPAPENSTDVKLDPSINTVDDLLKEDEKIAAKSSAPEDVALPEQTPAQKWQELSDSVKAFLEEVVK